MSVAPGTKLDKDPNEILVYEFDWTLWLGTTPEIASSTFAIQGSDALLTKDQETTVAGNKKTRVRLTAGTLGNTYEVENKIVTNETPAQTAERSFLLEIMDR